MLRAMSHLSTSKSQLHRTRVFQDSHNLFIGNKLSPFLSVAGFYWLRHTLSIDCDRAYESDDMMELALNVASLQRIKLQKPNLSLNPILSYP